MARLCVLVILALVVASQVVAVLENKYIIRIKPATAQDAFTAKLNAAINEENARESNDIENKLVNTYSIGDFKGYSGQFSQAVVQRLRRDSRVLSVSEDGEMYAVGTQVDPPSWGLTRVSERDLELTSSYTYPDSAGSGVTAYIVDTGILLNHTDFGGRATWGKTCCEGCVDTDDNGHGTHCASTIAGMLHGVAKNASLVAVKVLSGSGSGTYAGVIAGINWVADQVKSTGNKRNVVNMSLGGPKSQDVNDAVAAAIAAGANFAIAAGNESQDACNRSPASTPGGIIVAASNRLDARASFSNWGPCVQVIAPGQDITGAWNDGKTKTISGTSMAAPHVAGVAALYLGENGDLTPPELLALLKSSATKDKITDVKGSPNLLIFNVAGDSTVPTPTPTPTPTPSPPPPSKPCPWWWPWCHYIPIPWRRDSVEGETVNENLDA